MMANALFIAELDAAQERITSKLQDILSKQTGFPKLHQAMEYGVMNGGKRLRPFLVYACADLFHCTTPYLDTVAAAIELIHCYSLIHDDLPDMDNSPLRRGNLSCWRQYDAATAILVGDTLQALAFEILTEPNSLIPLQRQLQIINLIAHAAGAQGMVAGQMMDMFPDPSWSLEDLYHLQSLKTGKLLEVSCLSAGIIAGASTDHLSALQQLGHHLGLMYQITDDILDQQGSEAALGKPIAQDEKKITPLKFLGFPAARQLAEKLYHKTQTLLEKFDADPKKLTAFSEWIVERII